MPFIINQISGGIEESHNSVIVKTLKKINLDKKDIVSADINKISLDARKQNNIHFVYSIYVKASNEIIEKKLCNKYGFKFIPNDAPLSPEISKNKKSGKVVIAGFGPAGMFCGLVLAEYGYKPLILERGKSVDERIEDVNKYWYGENLNSESNVQFGEGGAGTFSDGKLTTRINDPLCRYVLKRFVEFGAPKEILVKAKPHIGTDNLRNIVKQIRERIIELGGEIHFGSKLEEFENHNGTITSVKFGESDSVETSALVLAIGHSARDTFKMLAENNIYMQPKPFSVGVRIEHKQADVNYSLYGKYADNPNLPVGEYQLSHRQPNGRCAYTFCMCPGGEVVASASEDKTIVTNGMSKFARDGENANAALVVSVSEKDYGNGILDGMNFARKIEQNAYKCSPDKKSAPASTVSGFVNKTPTIKTSINPTYSRGIFPCDFEEIFPSYILNCMNEGLSAFSKKMKCFGNGDAIMTAPETRTSSPIRITRTENMNSLSAQNLFPCGEGAGYAGGIMSAAVDGIKTALAIMKQTGPSD